jgi:hypothetical protein
MFDRLLRGFAGRTVEATLTIWGGNFAAVTADFGRAQSRFLICMRPLEDGQTLCQGIVYARRNRSFLRVPVRLNLWARRAFTHGYLVDEARRLRRTRYNPASLGPIDQDIIDFFQWVSRLPQVGPISTPPKASEDDDETNLSGIDVGVRGNCPSMVANAASK